MIAGDTWPDEPHGGNGLQLALVLETQLPVEKVIDEQ
jgi:hypothetical protein